MERSGPIRIMVYQRAYWPLFGGYANHLRHRLRLLPPLGIEPWVLTHGAEGLAEEEVVDDVPVRRVRVPGLMNRRSILAEAALFPAFLRSRSRYDLALISSANVSGPFIRHICGRPVIRESIIGEDHLSKFTPTPAGKAKEFCFRAADFAVTISPALEKAYLDAHWPEERLALIPRGVDGTLFRPAAYPEEVDRLRGEIGLPERPAVLFLTVGAVRERKGHADLVEAWRLLAPAAPSAHLIVVGPVGDEAYFRALEKRVAELGLGGRIHFRGRSDRVPEYMRCCDGFVFASQNEGFPNSVIEAMSSGLPVAAFDIEGILRFIVEDGRDGLIVPAGNHVALAREIGGLALDPVRRERLGRAARSKVLEKFSLEKEAEAHARLYWDIHREQMTRGVS